MVLTRKTFAGTWIPQDAMLISSSASIFLIFLTLLLLKILRLWILLCLEYTAVNQHWISYLSITFRKNNPGCDRDMRISIKDMIRRSEIKKKEEKKRETWMSVVDGDAGLQLRPQSTEDSGLHLLSLTPSIKPLFLNVLTWSYIHTGCCEKAFALFTNFQWFCFSLRPTFFRL